MSRARALATAALLLLAWGGIAEACPVCYGNGEGRMVDAARSGTFLLLGVVVLMQLAFAAFFLHLRRAARRAECDAADSKTLSSGGGPGELRSVNS